MSHYTIYLKGETYFIPYSRKPGVLKEINDITTKIDNYKNMIKDLEIEKKKKSLDLLDERQNIIYKNQYPKQLTSDELRKNKQFLKREKLLKDYDDAHGTYIQPTI